jgi:NAD(P)-dependent dehydrogenase (short-subunit alcohol dehydrogenase family)
LSAKPLSGRHAVVTGGGRGIGAAVAGALAGLGADLTLMGRNTSELEKTAEELRRRYGIRVEAVPCDVADPEIVATAFGVARSRLGDPWILVNNAGLAHGGPFLDTSWFVWQRLLAVNVLGAVACIREVLPALIRGGSGRIVNMASVSGLKGTSHAAAYTASKHALVGLTRSLAAETAKSGVTVNAVCPGYTDTGMARKAIENLVAAGRTEAEAQAAIARSNPQGRLIRPEEVASTVAWLCTADAEKITGQALEVAPGG